MGPSIEPFFRKTPFDYTNQRDGIKVRKNYYVMANIEYWNRLPHSIKRMTTFIKKINTYDRAIFSTNEDLILPIFDSEDGVLMVEKHYMD